MTYKERLQGEYGRLLREASAHFEGKHGYVRMTEDVAVLMMAEGLAAFQTQCVGKGYVPALAGASKTFRDTETQVRVKIITTGEYPGDGRPKAVAFPDPVKASVEVEGVRVVTLEKLIELKLASGMSTPHRLRDLADVQDLIGALNLLAEFAEQLDESVRSEYQRLWQTVHDAGRKRQANA